MSYITLAVSKQYLGANVYESAYDDFNSPGSQDDNVLQADIDGVNARIDMAIMQVYDKQITGTKALSFLKDLAGRLLLSRAYERFSFSEVPESVVQQRREATAALLEIQRGDLRFDDESQQSRGSSFYYSFQSSDSQGKGRTVFDRKSMGGF